MVKGHDPHPMYVDHGPSTRYRSAPDLGALDSDAALELKRLQAAVREIGELAVQAQREQGAVVTLAWLRRLTREVDRLQACWLNALQEPLPLPRRRRDDTEPAPQ